MVTRSTEAGGSRRNPRTRRGRPSVVAGVDDAETIPVRIGEHDEVRISRVRVPQDAAGAEAYKTLDLGGLFGCVVGDEVEVHSRMLLGWRERTLQSVESGIQLRYRRLELWASLQRELGRLVEEVERGAARAKATNGTTPNGTTASELLRSSGP